MSARNPLLWVAADLYCTGPGCARGARCAGCQETYDAATTAARAAFEAEGRDDLITRLDNETRN